jgi:hypothetical protein
LIDNKGKKGKLFVKFNITECNLSDEQKNAIYKIITGQDRPTIHVEKKITKSKGIIELEDDEYESILKQYNEQNSRTRSGPQVEGCQHQ